MICMSLKEIAKLTGVSVSTVSRVLSGKDPKFASQHVRDRIWETARGLQYVPNQAARVLQGKHESREPYQILVAISPIRDTYNNDFFHMLVQAVSEQTARSGCMLGKMAYVDEFLDPQPEQGKTAGVVVMGRCEPAMLHRLNDLYPYIACVGLNPFPKEMDQVLCDGKLAAEMAVEHLLGQGYTRIGYMGECVNEIRYRGYRETLQKHGIAIERGLIFETSQSEQGGAQAAQQVLKAEQPPTALFCANDATAIGLLKALRWARPDAAIPAMISIDNIEKAQRVEHALTTIHIPVDQMGAMTVKVLLDRMQGGHSSPLRVEFPGSIVRRKSS